MKRRVWSVALPILGAALIATSAHASSTDDGNAGLTALNHGSFDEAIRLFSHAIKAGDLSTDDQEFAYLNRGKAYLAKGRKTLALADFRKAARLKPDDAEAQAALQSAVSGRAAQLAAPAAPQRVDPKAAWGPLALLVGNYWMLIEKDPVMYTECQWQSAYVQMTCTGLTKTGKAFSQGYQIDPATRKITYFTLAPDGSRAEEQPVEVSDRAYAIDITKDGKYSRLDYTSTDATAFQVSEEDFDGTDWKTQPATLKLVAVSADVVQALGWKEGKDSGHSFWKDLGKSLAGSVAAGIVSGLTGTQPQ
jgi:tetratricopeptide (TPR) repeat protein